MSLKERVTRLESAYGAEEHEPAQVIVVQDPEAPANLGPPPPDLLESLVTQLNHTNPRAAVHIIMWNGSRLLCFGDWAREKLRNPDDQGTGTRVGSAGIGARSATERHGV